jgi:hypothetical protein
VRDIDGCDGTSTTNEKIYQIIDDTTGTNKVAKCPSTISVV